MNPKVDFFFEKDSQWKKEYALLRKILLDCGLDEALKWGHPCYTFKGRNIVLIHGFKEYCALLFHKGVLLKDVNNILVQQTENVQSARQIRFTSLEEIVDQEKIIKQYVYEAVEVEKAGIKVPLKKTSEYEIPEELQQKMESDPDFKEAFKSLTPGRQRGYFLYFSQAKQSKTREARIEKCIPKIYEGKGWNER
ncbi:YdeI/OmpD-associated family protein [Galbibacter sp. BG1]|uniref:YdeI/OmpD-associated family protein n=1 Tax=Galbibacter sp. BG1 TaxID=1170699 RepID=UPI0015C1181F|nr:YdeI family protein [Galbibacter sp. BG1]QLE02580.1 YdeI/OmpD-associated family protein [Galbibacter sp. BG1]